MEFKLTKMATLPQQKFIFNRGKNHYGYEEITFFTRLVFGSDTFVVVESFHRVRIGIRTLPSWHDLGGGVHGYGIC